MNEHHEGILNGGNNTLVARAPEMAEDLDTLRAAVRDLIESVAAYPDDTTLAVVSMEAVRRLTELVSVKASHCQVSGKPCGLLHDFELCICHGRSVE